MNNQKIHIEKRLREYVLNTTNSHVDLGTPLIENGIIDSMGVMELITFIQANFDIEFTDEDLTIDNFKNVNTITKLILRKNGTQLL